MIKIEIEVTDVDYDGLIDRYLPQVLDQLRQTAGPLGSLLSGGGEGLARTVLRKASPSTRDRLAAELINANAGRLSGELEALASRQGVSIRIAGLRAREKP